MRIALPLLLILAPLAGCATRVAVPAGAAVEVLPPPEVSPAWREVAHDADIGRIETLADRYAALLGAGGSDAIRVDARERWPDPTPGVYDCRITRLAVDRPVRTAKVHRAFPCFIGDDRDFLTLTKSEGSERPGGRLWRDTGDRMVFLGGVPGAHEATPNAYGDDPATNRVGILERIGEFRWRLIFDAPRPGVAFDVLELTPAAPALLASR